MLFKNPIFNNSETSEPHRTGTKGTSDMTGTSPRGSWSLESQGRCLGGCRKPQPRGGGGSPRLGAQGWVGVWGAEPAAPLSPVGLGAGGGSPTPPAGTPERQGVQSALIR